MAKEVSTNPKKAKRKVEMIPCFFCPKTFLTYRCWHLHDIHEHRNVVLKMQEEFEMQEAQISEKKDFQSSTSKMKEETKTKIKNSSQISVNCFYPNKRQKRPRRLCQSKKRSKRPQKKTRRSIRLRQKKQACHRGSKRCKSLKKQERKARKCTTKTIHNRIHTEFSTASITCPPLFDNTDTESKFPCQYCRKRFKQWAGKIQHERTHTGEKPYQCDFCPKAFSQLSNKQCHERTHTGEKPYRCHYCPKKFGYLTSARNHERIHTGELPYKCQVCFKMFRQLSNWKEHGKTHTETIPLANLTLVYEY